MSDQITTKRGRSPTTLATFVAGAWKTDVRGVEGERATCCDICAEAICCCGTEAKGLGFFDSVMGLLG
ncbi:hypothetical protein ERO13_D11G213901v2 [Gossypium hirsutum]|nr:hypothetical protein ERO13_D11G213901v2 [Gossypium hirsutum]